MRSRLAHLDAIKVLLVVGVIAMHSAITYGLDGSWYLESYEEMPDAVAAGITILLGTGWLFGLGLFFLIAGRFTAPSFDRAASSTATRGRTASPAVSTGRPSRRSGTARCWGRGSIRRTVRTAGCGAIRATVRPWKWMPIARIWR